jgi:putative transposase
MVRGTSRTIGSVIRGFKIGVAKWMRENTGVRNIWQRNYYEHIIRNDASLNRIRQYIADNPASWAHDEENPHRTRSKG